MRDRRDIDRLRGAVHGHARHLYDQLCPGRSTRAGNVRCFNGGAHNRDDRHPSMQLHPDGGFKCTCSPYHVWR